MSLIKLTAEQRKHIILTAALKIVKSEGLGHVNFESIGKHTAIPTSPSTVKHHFGKRDDLWDAVIEADKSGKARKDAEAMGYLL